MKAKDAQRLAKSGGISRVVIWRKSVVQGDGVTRGPWEIFFEGPSVVGVPHSALESIRGGVRAFVKLDSAYGLLLELGVIRPGVECEVRG